jgi:hypothetical protein
MSATDPLQTSNAWRGIIIVGSSAREAMPRFLLRVSTTLIERSCGKVTQLRRIDNICLAKLLNGALLESAPKRALDSCQQNGDLSEVTA